MELIPKTKHAIIRICKLVLQTERDITVNDFNTVQQIFQDHLASGMSPHNIKQYYNITYSNFGMCLKGSFNLTLLNHKDSVNNYFRKVGRSVTDEKALYYKACQFKFDPYLDDFLPGYENLLTLGIYHPVRNPSGVCRDHMMSRLYGWHHDVDPTLISHPANCHFITNHENIKKGSNSIITVQELQNRIRQFKSNKMQAPSLKISSVPRSKSHREKLSKSVSDYHRRNPKIRITNGVINRLHIKDHPIPDGFWRGMTRHKK